VLLWRDIVTMKQSLPIREALRIYRLTLLVKLAFLGLGLLAILRLGGSARLGLLMRSAPTLLLAILVLPPWLEGALGQRFLALVLGLDVLVESLASAPSFFDRPAFWPERLDLPWSVASHWIETSPIEPFFFLLIPLILLAWGYGRRGAVWGSTWATILHLGTGVWALHRDILSRGFFLGATTRVALLYLVPSSSASWPAGSGGNMCNWRPPTNGCAAMLPPSNS